LRFDSERGSVSPGVRKELPGMGISKSSRHSCSISGRCECEGRSLEDRVVDLSFRTTLSTSAPLFSYELPAVKIRYCKGFAAAENSV
jgi:hypothetical protein